MTGRYNVLVDEWRGFAEVEGVYKRCLKLCNMQKKSLVWAIIIISKFRDCWDGLVKVIEAFGFF